MGVELLTEKEISRFEEAQFSYQGILLEGKLFDQEVNTFKAKCLELRRNFHHEGKFPPKFLKRLALERWGSGANSLYKGFGLKQIRSALNRLLVDADFDYKKVFGRLKEGSPELDELLSKALFSTTYFNRDGFVDELVPLLRKIGKLNILNPGCSFGGESYSLAFGLYDAGIDARILASDANPEVFDVVPEGRYRIDDKGDRQMFLAIYGDKLDDFMEDRGTEMVVREPIKKMVDFVPFNLKGDLLDNPDPESEVFQRAPYDAIVCRHTMVYLQKRILRMVLQKFYELMKEDGILCVGKHEAEQDFIANHGLFKQVDGHIFIKYA